MVLMVGSGEENRKHLKHKKKRPPEREKEKWIKAKASETRNAKRETVSSGIPHPAALIIPAVLLLLKLHLKFIARVGVGVGGVGWADISGTKILYPLSSHSSCALSASFQVLRVSHGVSAASRLLRGCVCTVYKVQTTTLVVAAARAVCQ